MLIYARTDNKQKHISIEKAIGRNTLEEIDVLRCSVQDTDF
ncbi:MAG: hypothetical protein ACK5LY_04325 [Lachnospirales bacterium]